MPRNAKRTAGSALVETAIMLPVVCFLFVAALYFGSATVLRQELFLLARYAAETDGFAPFTVDPGAAVPVTTGAALPDGEFARWNGPFSVQSSDGTYLTEEDARSEMVKASWDVQGQTTFDPLSGDLDQSTSVSKTFEGYLFYDCGAKDRAPEVADQESRWMARRSVSVSASHDAAIYGQSWGDARYGIAGLPPPSLATSVAGVARRPFSRDLGHDYSGTHPAVEDLVVGYWQGPWPVSGYPDYKGSRDWWLPD